MHELPHVTSMSSESGGAGAESEEQQVQSGKNNQFSCLRRLRFVWNVYFSLFSFIQHLLCCSDMKNLLLDTKHHVHCFTFTPSLDKLQLWEVCHDVLYVGQQQLYLESLLFITCLMMLFLLN